MPFIRQALKDRAASRKDEFGIKELADLEIAILLQAVTECQGLVQDIVR